MTDLETREKIMKAARLLFADRGYEGTSVREIAKTAEVNIASLNYYFSSKENLFLEIIQAGHTECSEQMRLLFDKNNGHLENTLVEFFRYFLANSPDLLSHFKIMMSSQHSHPLTVKRNEDGIYGPPGGMVIAGALRIHAPTAPEVDLHWALKTLFSHVSHLALIYTCCERNNNEIPFSSQSDLERSIRRLTRIVLTELKYPQHTSNNP